VELSVSHPLSLSVWFAAGAVAVQTGTVEKPLAFEARMDVSCQILCNWGVYKRGTRQCDTTEQARLGRRAREASRQPACLVYVSPCADCFAAETLDMPAVGRYD